MRIWRAGACLVVLGMLGGCAQQKDPGPTTGPLTNTPVGGEISGHGIGHGSEVKVEDHLAAGKWTVIDFSSEYCPPCRMMAPRLAKMDEARDDVVVVTIDINRPDVQGIDWDSPVARQYGLDSIPHFRVYTPEGKLDSEGDEARTKIETWLTEAGA